MESIGRYRIIRELGRGAMGIVYLAEDPAIGRAVAIKTINLDNLGEGSAEQQHLRERLMREARTAGILSHPGIVTIYDITHTEHLACVVMEFVEGRTLYDRMSAGPLAPEEVLNILDQAASAMDYAHSKGVLHRDIKPANLMVTTDGTVKIMDFGIARIASQKTATTSMVLGTPSYMAPEQISAKPLSPGSDQFSLAVMAFELIAGQKPFAGESMSALLYSIVFQDPLSARQLNPTLGDAVESVLRTGLAKEAVDRYPNCTQFVRALRNACETKANWRPNRTVRGSMVNAPSQAVTGGPSWTQSTPSQPVIPPPPPSRTFAPPPQPVPPPPAERIPEPSLAAPPSPPAPMPAPVAAAVAAPLPAHEITGGARKRGSKAPVIAVVAAAAALCGYVIYATWPKPESKQADVEAPPALVEPTPAQPTPKSARKTELPANTPLIKPPAADTKTPAPPPASGTPAEPKQAIAVRGAIPIEFVTAPPQALITFKDQTCNSPCALNIPPGEQHVKVERQGYKTLYQRVSVPGQLELVVKLEPIVGWLDVPGPKDAVVYIDGKAWSRPAPVSIPVPPGEHTVWLIFADGHKSNEQRLSVKEDARYPLSYQ